MAEKGKVPVGTIATFAIAGGGVAGVLYLGYKYFVEPGNIVLSEYRFMLEDIYKETKKFLDDNAKLSPPVYGLTAGQEEIIKAKEARLEYLKPEVTKVLESRSLDVNTWVSELIAGIVIAYGISVVVPKLLDLLKAWRQKPESAQAQSSHGNTHLVYEIILNEMSLSGNLNIASGFQSWIQSYYTAYTAPAIEVQMAYFNALIPGLAPGTLEYIVATSMLSYLQFEISAAGIMGTMWAFWLPI